ncbi:hypothetical protein EDB19DRAFT_1911724 [Suillus lakei]|nr:hypothetical protein EDB19DRAFT_1911724 [Suillus lakei]
MGRFFSVPPNLQHLPCVPLPFLQRYASREPDDVHTQYLVMPSTIQRDEGVVVVWEMGKWTVHILNPKHLASSRMYEFPKQQPAQVNGEDWRDDPLL